MVKLDKKELMKIAKLSSLKLYDSEIESLIKDINVLLEYMEELQNVKFATEVQPTKNVNIFRQDKSEKSDPSAILKLAPKSKDNYFSVPSIMSKK